MVVIWLSLGCDFMRRKAFHNLESGFSGLFPCCAATKLDCLMLLQKCSHHSHVLFENHVVNEVAGILKVHNLDIGLL